MNILPSNDVQAARDLETVLLQMPQIQLDTAHNFHAGCYARTIKIPKGGTITGAQIKIPTLLIISGDVLIGGIGRFTGYHILEGTAGRKNAFHAFEDTWLTMIFATIKKTVEAVEDEFTDETSLLITRK